MKTPEEPKTLYVQCQCHTEGFIVERDEEMQLFYVSMWELGSNSDNSLTLWERVRHAWRILWTGKPYGDDICLSDESAKKVAAFLTENLTKEKAEKTLLKG